jgi:DNA invertase Pin-like site-specific DNA recombinase
LSVARKTLIFQCFQKYRYLTSAFNRPGFQRMLADIKAGRIKRVIVKDYCAIIGLNQKDLENQGILA